MYGLAVACCYFDAVPLPLPLSLPSPHAHQPQAINATPATYIIHLLLHHNHLLDLNCVIQCIIHSPSAFAVPSVSVCLPLTHLFTLAYDLHAVLVDAPTPQGLSHKSTTGNMFGDLSAAVVSQTLLLCTIVSRELTTSHSGGQPPRQRHITIGLILASSLQPMCAGSISGLHQTMLPQSIGLDPGGWRCTIPIARSRTPKIANRPLCPGIWRACMRLPRAMLIASRRLCHFFGCNFLSRLWVEHHGAEQRHGPKVSPMLYCRCYGGR